MGGRKSTTRLSMEGVNALKKCFKVGNFTSVEAFCGNHGVHKSIYYKMLSRKTWFEKTTVEGNFKSLGVPNFQSPKYYEDKDEIDCTPNYISLPITTFIGRGNEIKEVEELLTKNRLVTLYGAGGCGKSRLMLQIVSKDEKLLKQYEDGICLIELATNTISDSIPQTIVSRLNLHDTPNLTITQTLINYLKPKGFLLILDNCEHLIVDCASLVEILQACPNLTILTTSREILNVPGEYSYRVPPLSLPTLKNVTRENLKESESAELFCERANLANNAFYITKDNAEYIADICHRLGGIPLAIELVAARTRSYSIGDIHAKLDRLFELAGGGSRTALPRHQTLRSLIDWSYDLLTEKEQYLFRNLSVFSSSWTVEAAEMIISDNNISKEDIFDMVSELENQSLIEYEKIVNDFSRYRLLEPIRQYAVEKCVAWGDEHNIQSRYCDYFLSIAEEACPELYTAKQEKWLQRLTLEKSNLDMVLVWCAKEPEYLNEALRLIASLYPFWVALGRFTEYRERCEPIIQTAMNNMDEYSSQLQSALVGVGHLAFLQSDFISARQWWTAGIKIAEQSSDAVSKANFLVCIAGIDQVQGNNELAKKHFEEAIPILAGTRFDRVVADILQYLGIIAYEQGNLDLAENYYKKTLTRKQQVGDNSSIAFLLHELGNIAKDRADYSEAANKHFEALALYKSTNHEAGQAMSLNDLGVVAICKGEMDTARSYIEQSRDIHDKLQNPRGIATTKCNLGIVSLHENKFAEAKELLLESLSVLITIQDTSGICRTIGWLACIESALDCLENCFIILNKQEQLYQVHHIAPLEAERTMQQKWLSIPREKMSLESLCENVFTSENLLIDDDLIEILNM
jgi:predicted ATPase